MASFVLTGAHIKMYINNKVYKVAQSVSIDIDYGETEIRGIDAPYAQEIASNIISVKGKVNGLRLKMSGGIQAHNLRPLFTDSAAAPYISIRIQDRQSGEDIIFIPQAKVVRESHQVGTKQTYKLNFEFTGIVPLMALDRAFT
jgi:hypothetical protein